MTWIYLVVAGFLEIGWPLGLKIAEDPDRRIQGIVMAVCFMAASGTFLWLARGKFPWEPPMHSGPALAQSAPC